MKKNKICHLTSVHSRYDVRIYLKECISIAKYNFDTILMVADGKGDEITAEGIQIIDIGNAYSGRLDRAWNTVNTMFHKALTLDADIYHFHDPELLRIALKLKKAGKIVIYDTHEDVPRDILDKHWIPAIIRKPFAFCFELFEDYVAKRLDYVITATPFIRDRFVKVNSNTLDVNNFPLLLETSHLNILWTQRTEEVCYIGVIDEIRGIREVVKGIGETKYQLNLAGSFSDEQQKIELSQTQYWQKSINYLGLVNRAKAIETMNQSKVGIVTFLPAANHINAQPNKIFEYMAAGLALITSNFPLWQFLVKEEVNCGICVNPNSPQEIAAAINYLFENDDEAREMGERGRKAVMEKFNWAIEEKKILAIYQKLLN